MLLIGHLSIQMDYPFRRLVFWSNLIDECTKTQTNNLSFAIDVVNNKISIYGMANNSFCSCFHPNPFLITAVLCNVESRRANQQPKYIYICELSGLSLRFIRLGWNTSTCILITKPNQSGARVRLSQVHPCKQRKKNLYIFLYTKHTAHLFV